MERSEISMDMDESILDMPLDEDRILAMIDDPNAQGFPRGYLNPDSYDESDEIAVMHNIENQRTFFRHLEKVLLKRNSKTLARHREQFERNAEQMLRLARMNNSEREKLPMSEFFPYFADFDSALRSGLSSSDFGVADIRLDDLTFTPQFVSRGGFADIYKVTHKDGMIYALKLYHHGHKIKRTDSPTKKYLVKEFKRRIIENQDLFSQPFFTNPRLVPSSDSSPWYVMDYFEGIDAQTMIKKGAFDNDKDLKGRLLLFYAEMLSSVHQKGFLVCDNAWNNVLVNSSGFKACDLDFYRPISDNQTPKGYHKEYGSREHITSDSLTITSDLESFALMTYHLLTGRAAYQSVTDMQTEFYFSMRENREIVMPSNFPSHLEQVVGPLISHPRDDSMTIDEFKSAIKLDFKM